MNRRFTTFLGLLAAFGVQAQDYLANDPVWSEISTCAVPYPCIAYDSYYYRTAGDSVVAGNIWTKVTREGSILYSWQGSPNPPPDCQGMLNYGPNWYAHLLIREEGRQMRIWDGGSDQLLYDFDLHVGDTLPISWNNWNPGITVIAVDSVLIGTEMRARYELGNSGAQYIVEGVGSSNGLFEPISNFLECGYSLECFGLGDQGYYSPLGAGPCDLALGIGLARHSRTASISVDPNPGTDHFTISLPKGLHTATLFDAMGRMVHQQRISDERAMIQTAHLPSGVYLVKLDEGLKPLRWVKE